MFKKFISNTLAKHNPGVVADVDCSQFLTCGSCIAQEGCGFCGNLGGCVSGGWFGALDKSTCGLNDYYYHQCHMSTLPLGIISIVLISIVVISIFIGIAIFCCCLCCQCCQDGDMDEDDTGEDRPLLGSRYLRRSSTYYQWNRAPAPKPQDDSKKKSSNSKNKKINNTSNPVVPIDELPESLPSSSSAEQSTKNWEDRRTALLKKYAREPSTN